MVDTPVPWMLWDCFCFLIGFVPLKFGDSLVVIHNYCKEPHVHDIDGFNQQMRRLARLLGVDTCSGLVDIDNDS